MDRFFGLDSPVMRALSLVADLVILNLLWLICCIPVVDHRRFNNSHVCGRSKERTGRYGRIEKGL